MQTSDLSWPELDGHNLKILIVAARFNDHIVRLALTAAQQNLHELGVAAADIQVVRVPGALEIAYALQTLQQQHSFDGAIALGTVLRGSTYHFEVVCNESARSISQLQLALNLPIANGILTCDSEDQAHARATEKGRDCARVVVEMVQLGRCRG